MPSLGADMSAGTLVSYRKQRGDSVARGEILAEVETDKGLIEVECFVAGTVKELLVAPGATVPVGTPLAIIATESEAATAAAAGAVVPSPKGLSPAPTAAAAPKLAPPPVPAEPLTPPSPARGPSDVARVQSSPSAPLAFSHATPAARRLLRRGGVDVAQVHAADPHGIITGFDLGRAPGSPVQPRTVPVAEGRRAATPRARLLAQAHDVVLTQLTGSGPGGYVVAADVEAAARAAQVVTPAAAVASESGALDANTRMRRAIAEATSRSKREIPHFYLAQTVPLTAALARLSRENEGRALDSRISPAALFVHAVATAVRKVPELNATYVQGRLVQSRDVHVTMAISLRSGGLVAPTIRNADQLSLDQLSQALVELVESAREGRLRSSQMVAGTIGVTSLGERGVETVFPVIMPPQVAMVGFGTITPMPCVVDDAVVACPAVVVTLAADHRVCDGHRGGLFLRALARALEEVAT